MALQNEKHLGKKIVYVLAVSEQGFKDFVRSLALVPTALGSIGVAYTRTHNYRYVTDARMLEGYNVDLSRAELHVVAGAETRPDFDTIISLFTDAVKGRR